MDISSGNQIKNIIGPMNRLLFLIIFSSMLAFPQYLVLAQTDSPFFNIHSTYEYGEQITFQATIKTDIPVNEIFLFLQPEGQNTRLEPVNINENGEISFVYDLNSNPCRPFSHINYWFRGTLTNGDQIVSLVNTFYYEDNRSKWYQIEDNHFQVNWHEGDVEHGQTVLNIANQGIKSAQEYLPITPQNKVRIYVYASAADLQSALQQNQNTWIAGHTSVDLGIILISSQPGPDQHLELERQIPHEIMHILEYEVASASYGNIPTWLTEGLASLAEIYPNPDYQRIIDNAIETDTLLPMDSLCMSFPGNASNAYLAYAQSASFVRFIHENYGHSAIHQLLIQYKEGMGCDEGVINALSSPLTQLDYRWQHEALGINAGWLVLEKLSPYIILLFILVLLPLFYAALQTTKSPELYDTLSRQNDDTI